MSRLRLAAPLLGWWILLHPGPASAQIQGPIQVEIRGDTVMDEGQRAAWSVAPWEGRDVQLAHVYQWGFGDGSNPVSRASETGVGHRYMRDGSYTISVSDGAGVASLGVRVRPVEPTIEVLSHLVDPDDRRRVSFQAVATDPGADTLTYAWDFGDGSPVRQDVDLTEPTHGYASPGFYEVALVVTDEDGLEDRRTLRVEVNPGFLGEIAGEVPRFAFAGESGKASLMNPLPGSRAIPLGRLRTLLTGAIPMGGGVADLSDAMGICMVNAGFWDDENEAHINFQLTIPSDSLYRPRTYIVGWDHSGGTIAPDQLLVNALVLGIDPSYEDTKAGAENMEITPGGGGLSAIADVLRGALGGLRGGGGAGEERMGPGRNWQLTSNAGWVKITKVTPERIHGEVRAYLHGAWLEAERSGRAGYAEVRGRFAWELDDVARANLLRCGGTDFSIESHTPVVEAGAVDYERPRVSVRFSIPVERESVTAATLELGWLDDQNGFHRVPGRIVHGDDGLTVYLVPDEPLDDAVWHRVRIRGGQGGVRSVTRETLDEDYEWRFATIPELVRRPGGGQ